MLNKFFLLLLMLAIGGTAYADDTFRLTVGSVATADTVNPQSIYTTIAVPTTSVALSKSISLVNPSANSVGVMYKATSSGTVTLTIQALRSFQKPTAENASDSTYISWNAPVSVSDTGWHMVTLDTVVMPYLRFQITGSGSNDASTTIQMKVAQQ